MEREKIIDKAKKLKELANRGVGGEQENARRMLETHKEKYNITDREIDGHSYSNDFFSHTSTMQDDELLAWILNDKEIQQTLMKLADALAYTLFKKR